MMSDFPNTKHLVWFQDVQVLILFLLSLTRQSLVASSWDSIVAVATVYSLYGLNTNVNTRKKLSIITCSQFDIIQNSVSLFYIVQHNIYLKISGWQVAADNNVAGSMYPDQSLYPSNSGPELCRRINKTLQRCDQIGNIVRVVRDAIGSRPLWQMQKLDLVDHWIVSRSWNRTSRPELQVWLYSS